VGELYPEQHAELALLESVLDAMSVDSRMSARRVRQPIDSTHDIANAFDAITYSKGGAVLARIAEARRATPRQVALSFLTRATTVFAIPKASSAEHAGANAAAGDLVLTKDEIAALDAAFPRGPKPRGLPML
jgi:diketogulonate reductase-like aldo/keto reductase